MSTKRSIILILAIALLALSVPVFAHHSFTAQFDGYKRVTLSGTLASVEWVNPHVYIHVDVKDKAGKVTNWSIESYPTAMLRRSGVTRSMFVDGQTLTVIVNPAKDGTANLGFLRHITFENGNTINFRDNDVEPLEDQKSDKQ